MHLGNLGEQVVLISEKAFASIHFQNYEYVSAGAWYAKYHEMDICHFVERMDQICQEERMMTRLKKY